MTDEQIKVLYDRTAPRVSVYERSNGWRGAFEVRYRALEESLPVHLCGFESQIHKEGGLNDDQRR